MSQDLDPDGVHLTPVSGLHYVLQLFDSTMGVLSRLTLNADSRVVLVQENVRQHADRLAFLETRHGHLASNYDQKFAADADTHHMLL